MNERYINKDASGLRKNVNLFSLLKTTVGIFATAILICMVIGFLWATRKSRCPVCQNPLNETGYIDEKGREEAFCTNCHWGGKV